MRLQDVTSSEPVTRLGLWLARTLPPGAGYVLTRGVAGLIARRKPEMYRIVRRNLRQILGPAASEERLDDLAHQLFVHAGQTYYDYFRIVGRPPEVLARAAPMPATAVERIKAELARGRGVLMLGIHMSNFDLGILSICAHGVGGLMLSLANPGPGFQFLNRLRGCVGGELMPITAESLREGLRRLKQGKIVMFGADWPVPEEEPQVEFFGRPSYLPLGPMRMALMGEAVVFVGYCRYEPDTGYCIDVEGPFEVLRRGDRRQDVLENSQRLAKVIEQCVGTRPEQWMMFHPMWPEAESIAE